MKRFTKEEIIKKVTEEIKQCTGTLITVGIDGYPRARVLEDHNPYKGFEFWFATNSRTRKIEEIENYPNVCIYYQPSGMAGYISITGIAKIRKDETARHFIWREEWSQYYNEPMSPDFIPIQIVPRSIEFYDSNINAHADNGFGPFIVNL
ncbi:MAG: pyridoxamine 5'-phosphate oxidase family protein [Spirochaetales bacterium]|nr:pyridoxamine 5'-phosphate oxidase family protein [Spirochaetales bacterium]